MMHSANSNQIFFICYAKIPVILVFFLHVNCHNTFWAILTAFKFKPQIIDLDGDSS